MRTVSEVKADAAHESILADSQGARFGPGAAWQRVARRLLYCEPHHMVCAHVLNSA
jgi:hypothetical protein